MCIIFANLVESQSLIKYDCTAVYFQYPQPDREPKGFCIFHHMGHTGQADPTALMLGPDE